MSLEDPTTSEDPAEDEGIVPEPPVIESVEEDKNRKVRRSLEVGDSIEQVYNVSRIVGVDAVREWILSWAKVHQLTEVSYSMSIASVQEEPLLVGWVLSTKERRLGQQLGSTGGCRFVLIISGQLWKD